MSRFSGGVMRRCGLIVISLILLGLSGCSGKTEAPAPVSEPKVAQTQPVASQSAVLGGVDLSKWQGATVDFLQIKNAGMHYVFVKATQGATGVDPDYKRNVTSAREAGLLVGSYHFYMTNDTPEAQFANLSRHLSLQPGDLPPVVDIEVLSRNSLPDTAANLKRFLSLIESRYGIKPIIYSGEYFANQYLSGFSQYPLWLAEYVANKAPQMPLDWKQWTFWQYTQQGKVAGVAGPVDLSRFNGSLEQLNGLRVMTVPR